MLTSRGKKRCAASATKNKGGLTAADVSRESTMATTATFCAIVLLCAAEVQGFVKYKKDDGGGAQGMP